MCALRDLHRNVQMTGAQRKNATGKPSDVTIHSASGTEPLEHQLIKILTSLAYLLLQNGYGYSRLSKLAKLAFVDAAKSIDDGTAQKVSIARIAALTGLTRVEVSQLVRSFRSSASLAGEPMSRAARVATGWTTDKEFLGPSGEPKTLAFSQGRRSFASLVKRYSGDIPARAMLIEMKRIGMVSHTTDDMVTLERVTGRFSRQTRTAIRAISPWIQFFASVGKVAPNGELASNEVTLSLRFESRPQMLAATREIEIRRSIFVESLKQLGNRRNANAKHQVDLSVAVAQASPKIAARKSRRRRR